MALGHAGDTGLQRRVDKQAQVVGIAGQGIVRAAADDNAGAFVGNAADGIEGGKIYLLLQGVACAGAGHSEHIGVHGNGKQEAFGLLVKVLQHLFTKTASSGGFLQDLFVIEGDAQLFRNADADLLAAAAELASDGDDGIHRNPPFCGFSIPFFAEKVKGKPVGEENRTPIRRPVFCYPSLPKRRYMVFFTARRMFS